MFRMTKTMAVAVVAGGIGFGALVLAAPALADTVTGPAAAGTHGSGDGNGGRGMGRGAGLGGGAMGGGAMGHGGGAMGGGAGGSHGRGADGDCVDLPGTAAMGTLSDAQRTALGALATEEKLAGDLYQTFAEKYDTVVFDHLAAAEDRHLGALRTLMARYGVTDPTSGQAAGRFTDGAVAATYDRLLAEGSTSEQAALGVARQVEQTDIDDLRKALVGLDAADVSQVYTRLSEASQRHLTAAGR